MTSDPRQSSFQSFKLPEVVPTILGFLQLPDDVRSTLSQRMLALRVNVCLCLSAAVRARFAVVQFCHASFIRQDSLRSTSK